MIILSADNRSIPVSTPYTYLLDNNESGVSTLAVTSVGELAVDDIILVGLFGNQSTEMFRVIALNTSTNVITLGDMDGLATTTQSAHSESSKVTVLPFNQVRFYWTAATGTISDEDPTFNLDNPLTGWLDIDPSSWFTTYEDDSHSTGFGWFLFRNSVTAEASQNSNAIPYAGFGTNTVQYIFSDFLSMLNNKQLRLVTQADMLSWLNEGLAIVRNKLNLTNTEYTASTPQTITFVAGTAEYQLPDDFGDLIQIVDARNYDIKFISLREAMSYTGSVLKYYIRGRYIGFVPTPDAAAVNMGQYTSASYRYRSKGSRLTSLDDYVDLPDHGANVIKDWMMWRACLKFQNPNAQVYYKSFNDGMNQLIVSSIQRDANLDSWSIAPWANA